MNEWEEDIEYEDPFKKIQLDIDECHRRMDAISSYQVNQCMKMILDLDYTVCSDRYRSEEMIQANSMFLDSLSIKQDMFAELINYVKNSGAICSDPRSKERACCCCSLPFCCRIRWPLVIEIRLQLTIIVIGKSTNLISQLANIFTLLGQIRRKRSVVLAIPTNA